MYGHGSYIGPFLILLLLLLEPGLVRKPANYVFGYYHEIHENIDNFFWCISFISGFY